MKNEINEKELGFSQEEIKEMIWAAEDRSSARKHGFDVPSFGETPVKKTFSFVLSTVIGHDFVKGPVVEFAAQLKGFSDSLNGPGGVGGPTALATKYGYSTPKLLSIKKDAAVWQIFSDNHNDGPAYSKSMTSKGKELRKGTGTSISAWPSTTDLSAAENDVLPGIETRFRENAAFAKSQKSIYTETDGITMHIEVNSTPFVPGAVKPDLEVELSDGGHPELGCTKSGYQGFNVYKSVGGGAFVFLCTCNEADFKDMSALPAKGVSAAWTYKAFYLFDGVEVGPVSSEITISVLGLI